MKARPLVAAGCVLLAAGTLWIVRSDSPRPPRFGDKEGYLMDPDVLPEEEKKEEGHAWEMFDWWYSQRAYPNALIPKSGFWDAFEYARQSIPADPDLLGRSSTWTSMGPDNVGGRMLALAIHPTAPSVVWAGAASGGLWRSDVAGEGANAWTRVETGFPSLSVSSIVIDAADPQNLWIGTGEISRYERPLVGTPGARTSYGLGVLGSTDGGATWGTTGLTWTFNQQTAVLAMRQHPTNAATLYAATSEGLFKTTDAGTTWANVHAVLMAMDVVVDPTDGNTVYVSHGQLGVPAAPDAGIYRSTDGGTSWVQLGGGLPTTDFGRTPLAISADGTRVFAGVSDAASRQAIGLYRSTNDGSTWQVMATDNWAASQAWYDNTIAVSPFDRDLLLAGGLDCYRTTNGGGNLSQVTAWYLGYDGTVPNGGPEGPDDYVHADHHWILWDPTDASIVYIASDGGVFKSTDAGLTWDGKNGGLVTAQFYAGFANGYSTTSLALGGLQDNGTLLYEGSTSWNKTFGGDGGWCAIDPSNEQVMYEEYVYLNIHKTTNGGGSWNEVHPLSSGSANFIAPFVLCPSAPQTLYGGRLSVRKTTNGGGSWFYPDGDSDWNGTALATIGVSNLDEDHVMAGTGNSSSTTTMEMRVSTNGGSTWTDVSAQLPDRYPTDFTYDPNDRTRLWATFSGYGTGHVFLSTDSGFTWADASGNLPDIPHQTVAADPSDPGWAYVGTDLGIFRTTDAGGSWTDFDLGMPTAMVLDLVIKLDDRRMRAATFGNGVWEVDLPAAATGVEVAAGAAGSGLELAPGRPNPFREATTIAYTLPRAGAVRLTVHDAAGRRVRTLTDGSRPSGRSEAVWDGRDEAGSRVAAGVYFLRLDALGGTETGKLTRIK